MAVSGSAVRANLESERDLIPAQKKEAAAAVNAAKAQLGDAEANMGRTKILCPFPARVMSASVEVGQVVAQGQTVARIADTSAAEIPVVIEPIQLQYLPRVVRDVGAEGSKEPNFPATVRYVGHEDLRSWHGRVTRIEPVDNRTRTVPLVVQVDGPLKGLDSDTAPPLLTGMYCRVDIEGRVVEGALTIPRSALREGDVAYVVRDGRLAICPIQIQYRMERELVIAKGLRPGDEVVLSPLAFPVDGMKLQPMAKSAEGLAKPAEATGGGAE